MALSLAEMDVLIALAEANSLGLGVIVMAARSLINVPT